MEPRRILVIEDDPATADMVRYALELESYVVDYAILSVFLPNIKLASTVGEQYAAKLEELSVHFMKANIDETHIGFVSGAKPATPSPVAKDGEKAAVEEDSNGQTAAPASKPAEATTTTKTHARTRIRK